MAKLIVSGGAIDVPPLFLGGVIAAGDLVDEVNDTFRANSQLLETDQEAFLARPVAEIYKVAELILQIAEISCNLNDIEFNAKKWMNTKIRPEDATAIYTFYFDLMSESGFGGSAQGESAATASTPPSKEVTQTPKRGPRKSK